MQNYYQFINGGYEIIDGKIRVNINNVVKNGIVMMDKIIQIQLENDYEKAKQYIDEYFVWTDEMKLIGEKLLKLKRALNGKIVNPLVDEILNEK